MVFGDYGSYGAYGGSPYGPVEGSSFLPPYYHPGMAPGGPSQDEFIGISKKKKKTGLEGFLKGIYNGAVNTVKGIFSVQGIAMTAATAGLVWATGGAALLPLAALGTGIGGFQMFKGIAQGDAEGVGEGVFTTGASLLGLKFTPKNVNLAGETYTLGGGDKLGLIGRFKALWGGKKFQPAGEGEALNIWQMGAAKFQSRFQPKSLTDAKNGIDIFDPSTWKSSKDVDKLPTLKMSQKEFKHQYKSTMDDFQKGVAKFDEQGVFKGDLKELEAYHMAAAKLNKLGAQACFPKRKIVADYLKLDSKYVDKINGLKGEKTIKKHFVDGSEIKYLDDQIATCERVRGELLEQFTHAHTKSASNRLTFMEAARKGLVEKNKDGRYVIKDSEITTD